MSFQSPASSFHPPTSRRHIGAALARARDISLHFPMKPKHLLSILLCVAATLVAAPKPNDKLPPWTEGYLDIHHINTGMGECSFLILPDGTTLLVDVGATGAKPPIRAAQVPSDERSAAEWVARYIERSLENAPKKIINYALLTHFHGDHMGGISADTKMSAKGDYQANGFTEVPDHIPYEKVINRERPDSKGPPPLKGPMIQNYKKFLDWQQKHAGLKVENFKVGVNNQIVLLNNPSRYPKFEIRNIAANGIVWKGKGTGTRDIFKEAPAKNIIENKCSITFRLSYGPFTYYSGGDTSCSGVESAPPTSTWLDIETPVAQATGPVEVAKANHHGFHDANSVSFLRTLKPRVIVIPTWCASQPSPNIWARMHSKSVYPGERDVFVTNFMKSTAQVLHKEELESSSHVVIRVSPGGEEYSVYRVSDTDESGRIMTVDRYRVGDK